jgi:hypothetical protein
LANRSVAGTSNHFAQTSIQGCQDLPNHHEAVWIIALLMQLRCAIERVVRVGGTLTDCCSNQSTVAAQSPLQGDEPSRLASGDLMLNGERQPCRPAELSILDESRTRAEYVVHLAIQTALCALWSMALIVGLCAGSSCTKEDTIRFVA